MEPPSQPRTSLVSRVREYSRGRFPKQQKPKPHGPVASRDQTITVSFICQSVIQHFSVQYFYIFAHHSPLTELFSGDGSSPHQEVDNFVLTLVQKDGIQGSKCWDKGSILGTFWLKNRRDEDSVFDFKFWRSHLLWQASGGGTTLQPNNCWCMTSWSTAGVKMCRDFIKATTLCVFSHVLAFSLTMAHLWQSLQFLIWSGFLIFCRIIADLKEEVWYQKCHDPECRNFRSSSKLSAVYDGFTPTFREYELSWLHWKVTRCPRRSAWATSWQRLASNCVLMYLLFKPVC